MPRHYLKFLILLLFAAVPLTAAAANEPGNTQRRFDVAVSDAKAAMMTDPLAAQQKAIIAKSFAERINGSKSRELALATAIWLQGEASYRLDDLDTATSLVARSLPLVRRNLPGSTLEGHLLILSGSIHENRTEVVPALSDFQNAYRIFHSVNDNRNQAKALIFLSTLYSDAKDYDAALKYLKQALDAYDTDPDLVMSIYNNRGAILQDSGDYVGAERELRSALAIARSLKSDVLLAQITRNIARGQLWSGRLATADQTIAQAYALSRKADANDMGPILSVAAQAAFQHGRFVEAGRLVDRTFAGIDPTNTTLSMREAHETAYKTFSALHQSDKALVHLVALKRLDDEATKLATTTKTALMAAQFDSANQELKITKLKQDELERNVAFERQQARIERMVFAGAAATTALIIAMLAVALITIRRSRNETRDANADLAITNAALGKALAAKTEFLATTSHEIRTPLNGILGMTQVMLADPALGGKVRERITLVHGAGITMRALVDDILDVAKMETGNMTIEAAPFDLRATLADAARLWEEQAKSKGVAFMLDLAECPTMVEGDAARVRQVVFNLLSNALKFTADGSIAVRAAANDDDSRVAIAVTDTGVGIPVAKLEEIFEAFRQADAGTTRQFGGTGLGLAICRNLARAMGGDVSVTSNHGEGSTFTVILPLVRMAPACAIVDDGTQGERALLVVDRNPITRAMFRSLFAPHVGRIEFAVSVDEAVTALRKRRLVRVLIDDATVRAGGDAHAALAAIARAAKEAHAGTVLLWPVTAESERAELLATGIDLVVGKPVSGGALIGAMLPLSTKQSRDGKCDEPSLVTQAA